MQAFRLTDEFCAPHAERALIASVVQTPSIYWQLLDVLPHGAFVAEASTWQQVSQAVEAEHSPNAPSDWAPSSDPETTARELADLSQRRLAAQIVERLTATLHDPTQPMPNLSALLEEQSAQVRETLREQEAGRLVWASDLVAQVLDDAEERRRQREDTGRPVMGLPTGLSQLDALMGGLTTGLFILAGAPGTGKTTLALQAAAAASQEVPVVYVTFENSPASLTLKAISARAGINPQQVLRGWAEPAALKQAAAEWRPIANRIALIEGTGRLTVAQIRAKALQAINRHKTRRCLVVVDYLQLWAKLASELRGLTTVRERVETLGSTLRELAVRLDSPVLALASQNRAQGDYGDGNGTASLDSLKESGDLEYAADAVMFLTRSKKRQSVAPARALDLTLAKNRSGDIGKVDLIFRPDLGIFREEARP
jgi:replicative DNA helicase